MLHEKEDVNQLTNGVAVQVQVLTIAERAQCGLFKKLGI